MIFSIHCLFLCYGIDDANGNVFIKLAMNGFGWLLKVKLFYLIICFVYLCYSKLCVT